MLNYEQRRQALLDAGLDDAAAEQRLEQEGTGAMTFIVKQATAATTPKERVYKIKRTLKGARVKVAGFDRSFSFGPVWENFVKAGTGPALTDQNKVRAHAAHLGVPNALKAKFGDVLAGLQAKLS